MSESAQPKRRPTAALLAGLPDQWRERARELRQLPKDAVHFAPGEMFSTGIAHGARASELEACADQLEAALRESS